MFDHAALPAFLLAALAALAVGRAAPLPALAEPDPWQGFVGYLEGLYAMHAEDRGLNEVLAGELPNAKGELRGGCGDEGTCDNPNGCGTGGCSSGTCTCHP